MENIDRIMTSVMLSDYIVKCDIYLNERHNTDVIVHLRIRGCYYTSIMPIIIDCSIEDCLNIVAFVNKDKDNLQKEIESKINLPHCVEKLIRLKHGYITEHAKRFIKDFNIIHDDFAGVDFLDHKCYNHNRINVIKTVHYLLIESFPIKVEDAFVKYSKRIFRIDDDSKIYDFGVYNPDGISVKFTPENKILVQLRYISIIVDPLMIDDVYSAKSIDMLYLVKIISTLMI